MTLMFISILSLDCEEYYFNYKLQEEITELLSFGSTSPCIMEDVCILQPNVLYHVWGYLCSSLR